jgi:adenine-specific DNA-methyltransferase
VTGAGSNAKIRAAIVDVPTGYYTENHVNYIVRRKDCEHTLEQLLEALRSDETIEFIQMLTGNTQISKTELQKIIPFSLDK